MALSLTNMTVGRPRRLILLFALPLMSGNICQQIYTVADGVILGRFLGADALAAVGATDWLSWMMTAVISGLAQGFCIRIAQRFGAKDEAGMRKSAAMAALLSLWCACLFALLSLLLLPAALRLLHTPELIFPQSLCYLRVLFCGIPFVFAYNYAAALLRAVGNSRAPLLAMLAATVVNVVLDLLLVVGANLGIAGAAAASVIAQGVSALACLATLRRYAVFSVPLSAFCPDRAVLADLLALGGPNAIQFILIALGGLILQRAMNGYGALFVAGYTAANKLYGLMEISAISFGLSMVTYMGQNMGAGAYSRVRCGLRDGVLIGVATALVLTMAAIFGGDTVVGLFLSKDAENRVEVLAVSHRFLRFLSIPLILLYLHHILRAALQGMGNAFIPLVSGLAQLVMRIAAALALTPLIGSDGILAAEPLSWSGSVLVLAVVCVRAYSKLPASDEAAGKERP